MGLFGMDKNTVELMIFWVSLAAIVLSAWALWMNMAGYTVDLTSSRPLTYPLRNSLARPWSLVLNKSYDLPNPYKGWTNDLQRSLPQGNIADYK